MMTAQAALLMLALPQSAATEGCSATVRHGTCFKNPGYNFTTAASAADCCAQCHAAGPGEIACASWTWLGSHSDGCHLKATLPAPDEIEPCARGASAAVRGSLPPAPPPPPPKPPAPKGAQNVLFMVNPPTTTTTTSTGRHNQRAGSCCGTQVIDDLRPEFNAAYGQTQLKTPSLDKFKGSSLTFQRAYVQYSHCSPSRSGTTMQLTACAVRPLRCLTAAGCRNSFLSGRSPQTTSVYNFIGAPDHFSSSPQSTTPAIALSPGPESSDDALAARARHRTDHFRMEGIGANWTALPQFFKEHGWHAAGGEHTHHSNTRAIIRHGAGIAGGHAPAQVGGGCGEEGGISGEEEEGSPTGEIVGAP